MQLRIHMGYGSVLSINSLTATYAAALGLSTIGDFNTIMGTLKTSMVFLSFVRS